MTDHQYYDKKVEPHLDRAIEACRRRNMPLVVGTQYDQEDGLLTTVDFNPGGGIKCFPPFLLMRWAAESNGEADALIRKMMAYAEEHGHDSEMLQKLQHLADDQPTTNIESE